MSEELLNAKEELQEINNYLEDLKQNFDIKDYLSESELELFVLDRLTENFGDVEICGMRFDAGDILKEMSPLTFDDALFYNIQNENVVYRNEMSIDDYERACNIVEGLEDKIDRREELVDLIEELENKNKTSFKP